MPSVKLTEVANGSPRPLMINPDHVASMRPRKTITPIDAQQNPYGKVSYNGTIVEMAAGDQHFVSEPFEKVMELFEGSAKAPELAANAGVPITDKTISTSGLVPQDQLPQFTVEDNGGQFAQVLSEDDPEAQAALAQLKEPASDEPTEAEAIKEEEDVDQVVEETTSVEKPQPAKKAPAKKAAPKKAAPSGGTDSE